MLTFDYTHKKQLNSFFQDWNVFLENFADIEFCIVDEQNDTVPTTVAPVITRDVNKVNEISTLPTTQEVQPDLK